MKWTPGWGANLPSLLLNHGEPLVVYRTNWVVVTRPFLVEDRNSLHHETDRIRHPRDLHNWVSKRTTSKELCFHFFVEIEIKFFKKGVGIMNAGQVKKRTSLLLVLITSSLKRNRFFCTRFLRLKSSSVDFFDSELLVELMAGSFFCSRFKRKKRRGTTAQWCFYESTVTGG